MKTCISLAALALAFGSLTLVTAAPAPSVAAAMLLDRVAIDSVIDTYFYNLDDAPQQLSEFLLGSVPFRDSGTS